MSPQAQLETLIVGITELSDVLEDERLGISHR